LSEPQLFCFVCDVWNVVKEFFEFFPIIAFCCEQETVDAHTARALRLLVEVPTVHSRLKSTVGVLSERIFCRSREPNRLAL